MIIKYNQMYSRKPGSHKVVLQNHDVAEGIPSASLAWNVHKYVCMYKLHGIDLTL